MKFFNGEISNIHSAALILGAAGLFSRLLGVLRDRLLAGHFGAGRELDVYFTAFQVPDFMSLVFVLGAGSAAILPIFQDALSKDRKEAHRLISHIVTLFLVASAVAAVIFFIFTPAIVPFIAPGFSAEEKEQATILTRIMLLSPILLGLSGILSAVLQSFQRFFAFALAPVLYNVGIIAGIIFFVPIWGLNGLALGVVVGALLHFLIQLQPVVSLGFTPRIAPHLFGDTLKMFFLGPVSKVFKLSLPRFLSLSITQITLMILIALGSTLAVGSIAVFKLANNLFYVPIGVFGVSYAVALFPRIHLSFLQKDSERFYRDLFLGIRTILFWIVPFAVLFIVLRAHIIRSALGSGAFSWEDTRLSAAILAVLALAMFAEGIVSLLIKVFYALENTWMPLVINISSSVVSIILAVLFTKVLSSPSPLSLALTSMFRISDLPHPEVLGLAIGFSLGAILNILLLFRALQKLVAKTFKSYESFPFGAILKIVLSALAAGAVAYGVRISFSQTLPLITLAQVLSQGTLAGIAGFVAYFASLYVMRSEDMFLIRDALQKRLLKLKSLPKYWGGEEVHHTHL